MRLTEIQKCMEKAAHEVGMYNDIHFDLSDEGTLSYWNNTPSIEYPSIVMEIGDTFRIDEGVKVYTIRINAGDRRTERGNNDWGMWDTLADSIIIFADKLQRLLSDGAMVVRSNTFTPLTQAFADNLAVVQTSIEIHTNVEVSGCEN